jgi:predicted CXXCH cytochrome family protein
MPWGGGEVKGNGFFLPIFAAIWLGLPFAFDAYGAGKEERCYKCHGDPKIIGYSETGRPRSVYIDKELMRRSVHGKLECTRCHSDINPDELPHPPHARRIECSSCHLKEFRKVFEDYEKGIHGRMASSGKPNAPRCSDCHGVHDIFPPSDPSSSVHRSRIPLLCSKCHKDAGASYEGGVHGRAPAVCTDCHGVHDIRAGLEEGSLVAKRRIPQTCGRCHREELLGYREGVHDVAGGVSDAPSCVDCHGGHGIKPSTDPGSKSYPTNIPRTCAKCHEDRALQRKYGLQTGILDSYLESYHGKKNYLGSKRSATCATCHGSHRITSSSDPRSQLHPSSRQKLCGRCHKGASYEFSKAFTHIRPSPKERPLVYWLGFLFKWFAILVVNGMFLYTLLDISYWIRVWIKGRGKAKGVRRVGEKREYRRWDIHQRIQHILFMSSVATLILTGFPLRTVESIGPVGKAVVSVVGGPDKAGIIHRIAAIGMISAILYHGIYVFVKLLRGTLSFDMVPRAKDFVDFWQMTLFLLGLREVPPKFGRYNYIEKFLYWAAGWGVVIMGLSGLILWFSPRVSSFLSYQLVEIASLFHRHEFSLAFFALLAFHMYFAHLRPDVFPMSWVWITGKISEEELKERHGEEWERLTKFDKGG